MTEEQKKLAVDNMKLVYSYIWSRHLNIEEWESYLWPAYCIAVKGWKSDLGKSTFSNYIYVCLDKAVCKELRYLKRHNGDEQPFSLNTIMQDGEVAEYEYQGEEVDFTGEMECADTLNDILSCCNTTYQRNIILERAAGKTYIDISAERHVSKQAVNLVVQQVKQRYMEQFGLA